MPEFPPDAAPREIVTAVHEQIARQSPEHAALVAAYEAIPRSNPRPVRQPRSHPAYGPRRQRMTVYTQLRIAGHGPQEAARKAGVGRSSASQYEADLLGTLGGAL